MHPLLFGKEHKLALALIASRMHFLSSASDSNFMFPFDESGGVYAARACLAALAAASTAPSSFLIASHAMLVSVATIRTWNCR